jgi:hypothetical protein
MPKDKKEFSEFDKYIIRQNHIHLITLIETISIKTKLFFQFSFFFLHQNYTHLFQMNATDLHTHALNSC